MARRKNRGYRSKLKPTGVSGKEWYLELLRMLPREMRDALAEEIDKSAVFLEKEIEKAAPRDTGSLRRTVRSYPVTDEGSTKTYKRRVTAGGEANGEKVGYARLLEFGWTGGRAQPFFFPTYQLNKKKIRARLARALSKGIKQAVKAQG